MLDLGFDKVMFPLGFSGLGLAVSLKASILNCGKLHCEVILHRL